MFRSARTAVLAAVTSVGALLALDVTSAGASTEHPESTKILPRLSYTAGAVDAAGGSLVAGMHVTQNSDTLETYYRSAAGRWGDRVVIPKPAGVQTGVQDVKVIAGTSGFFVIAWVYSSVEDNGEDPPDFTPPTVYAATRLPSGTITTPKLVLTANTFPTLSLGGNTNGDAALTLTGADRAARYIRGVGWDAVDLLAGDDSGHRRDAVAMMSPARTVDITYATPEKYAPGDDSRTRIVQQTMPAGASTFTRRDIYTAPDAVDTDFGISMDAAGLQTLVTNDADDAIKVYRENARRSPFVYRWRKAYGSSDDGQYEGPRVDSSGRYTRVTWSSAASGNVARWTRAFNGGNWGSSARGATFQTQYQPFRLAIASDGTGVELGVVKTRAGDDGSLLRGFLSRSSRDDVLVRRDAFVESVDSNAAGVSQRIDVEDVGSGKDPERTVVRVRR